MSDLFRADRADAGRNEGGFMSSAYRRPLPAHADLEQQKKLAKELLAAFNRGDSDAVARVRDKLPDKPRIVLADAQHVLAREYGFDTWRALRDHVDYLDGTSEPPLE